MHVNDFATVRSRRRIPRVLAGALLVATAAGSAAQAQGTDSPDPAASPSDIVWCHDEARSIVRRRYRWRCEHTVVDDAAAERVKQARVRRIQRVLEREREPLVPGKRLAGAGTGFFVSEQGHLLTNAHVIEECGALTVTPANAEERIAQPLEADRSRDLALLTTARASPRPARFRHFDEVIVGEPATLVGYPLYGKVVIEPVVITGEVAEPTGPRNPNVFTVNADVRRGNSGGPILDRHGRVMGVIFASIDTPEIHRRTGRMVRDIGIGLSLAVVRDFLRSARLPMPTSAEQTRLGAEGVFARAREFVAQVRCWR